MKKKLNKYKLISWIFALAIIGYFIVALSFMTNFYAFYIMRYDIGSPNEAGVISGTVIADMYQRLQNFNHIIFNTSLILILVTLFCIIANFRNKSKVKVKSFVFLNAIAIFALVVTVYQFILLVPIAVDYSAMEVIWTSLIPEEYFPRWNGKPSELWITLTLTWLGITGVVAAVYSATITTLFMKNRKEANVNETTIANEVSA